MHDGMPYGRNQGQGQGHSREVDRQSPTGLIFAKLQSKIMNTTKKLAESLCTPLSMDSSEIRIKFHRSTLGPPIQNLFRTSLHSADSNCQSLYS